MDDNKLNITVQRELSFMDVSVEILSKYEICLGDATIEWIEEEGTVLKVGDVIELTSDEEYCVWEKINREIGDR